MLSLIFELAICFFASNISIFISRYLVLIDSATHDQCDMRKNVLELNICLFFILQLESMGKYFSWKIQHPA